MQWLIIWVQNYEKTREMQNKSLFSFAFLHFLSVARKKSNP